jgi:hypothetical protein
MGKIQSLMFHEFIVITTKEGGIGIDFKGTDPAHVVIAFEYKSFSELIQALGRGSRDVTQCCSGTLISSKPLPCDIEKVIEIEMMDD